MCIGVLSTKLLLFNYNVKKIHPDLLKIMMYRLIPIKTNGSLGILFNFLQSMETVRNIPNKSWQLSDSIITRRFRAKKPTSHWTAAKKNELLNCSMYCDKRQSLSLMESVNSGQTWVLFLKTTSRTCVAMEERIVLCFLHYHT